MQADNNVGRLPRAARQLIQYRHNAPLAARVAAGAEHCSSCAPTRHALEDAHTLAARACNGRHRSRRARVEAVQQIAVGSTLAAHHKHTVPLDARQRWQQRIAVVIIVGQQKNSPAVRRQHGRRERIVGPARAACSKARTPSRHCLAFDCLFFWRALSLCHCLAFLLLLLLRFVFAAGTANAMRVLFGCVVQRNVQQ